MSLQSVSRSKVFWGAKCASAVTIEKDEANLSHMVDLRHSKINVKKNCPTYWSYSLYQF